MGQEIRNLGSANFFKSLTFCGQMHFGEPINIELRDKRNGRRVDEFSLTRSAPECLLKGCEAMQSGPN